jgi:hypothetical protein
MPLLDLNDDCLREIASWLPAREMVLSFRLSCKVLRSAAREDLIDRAIVAERPVLGALLVRGRAVIRTAYAELRRAELPASEDAEHWKKPLRALSEFRFYVALDVGREWASSREALASGGSDTFDGRLDFAEHQPSLANGMISLPMSGPAIRSGYDYDEGVWRDEVGGVHVVVVDVLSGKMMKLVDGPVLAHTDNFTHNHYECQRVPGCPESMDGFSTYTQLITIDPDDDAATGRPVDEPQSIIIQCMTMAVQEDDPGISLGHDQDMMHAITSMFA